MDWEQIDSVSSAWANTTHELALAQQFVATLDTLPHARQRTIFFDVQSTGTRGRLMRRAQQRTRPRSKVPGPEGGAGDP